MKTHLAIIISQVLVSLAAADTILIKDAKDGKLVGEVNLDAKESKFTHAGSTLTIERKASVMELRARALVIPRLEFREATLEEFARYLRQPNFRDDEDGEASPRPIINIVVNDRAKRNLRVSILLLGTSLYDVLAATAQKYELKVEYSDYAIALIDPK